MHYNHNQQSILCLNEMHIFLAMQLSYLFDSTCSIVISVVFHHLEWDCQHHQVVSIVSVEQTFHDFQDTVNQMDNIFIGNIT